MWKKLLKNKEFLKITREFLKRKEILDVVVFGSVTKGKEKPNDIDLIVVHLLKLKDVLNVSYEFRKRLEKVFKKEVHIVNINYKDIFDANFLARESLLSEGFSMRNQRFLAECFGYENFVLFKYSLGKMNKSQRMRFYYSLNGRGGEKGILEKNKSYKFSDNVIFSNLENSELMRDFFKKWEVDYIEFPMIVPREIVNMKNFIR